MTCFQAVRVIIRILTFPGIGGGKGKNLSLSPRCLLFDRVFLSELISNSLNCLSNFQFKVQSIPQLLWFFLIPLVICLERSHHLFNQRNASWSPAFSRALGQVAGYHAQFLSAFSQYFSFLWLAAVITFVLFSRLFIQKLTNIETHITTNHQIHYELEISIVW